MNIIYITKRSIRELIETFNTFDKYSGSTITLTFHKKDKRIINILDIYFPKVLVSIIFKYCINIILVDFRVWEDVRRIYTYYYLTVNIKEYNFENLIYAEHIKSLCNDDCHVNIDYNKQRLFTHNGLFGYYNDFMLKYYNKKCYLVGYSFSYEDECYEDEYENEDEYEDPRQLKYCVIIIKILLNIIHYNKRIPRKYNH